MVSKTVKPISKVEERDQIEKETYCNDCLYTWCKQRAKVTYCTMKTKGLFECESCLAKMQITSMELLEAEMNLTLDKHEILTQAP